MTKKITFDPSLFKAQTEAHGVDVVVDQVEDMGDENILQDFIGEETEKLEETLAHKVIVDSILSSDDTDLVTLADVAKDSIFGETDLEDAEDFVYDAIASIANMCEVSTSLKDDLVSKDEEVRMDALEEFRDILSDSMASVEMDSLTLSTILYNQDVIADSIGVEMDDITFDSVFFDESQYSDESECKKGRGKRKVPISSNRKCTKGMSNGEKTFFRRLKKGKTTKPLHVKGEPLTDKQKGGHTLAQTQHTKAMGEKPMTADAKKKITKSAEEKRGRKR